MRHQPSYASHLRVYEPLVAFPEPDRARWRAVVEQGQPPDGSAVAELERAAGLAALVGRVPTFLPDEQGLPAALVEIADGVARVCPLRTRIRAGLALAGFLDALPPEVARAFAPDEVAEGIEDELEQHEREHGELKEHVLTETWTVPLHWFIPFEPTERRLGSAGQRRSLRYLTAMSKARRRTARALDVLQRTIEGPVLERVEGLGRWLEEFHPHSVVELDYGGLVDLIPDAELRTDNSVEEVREALEALGDGEAVVAAEAYERVSVRWRELAVRSTAS
ncbi:MAG: hypothetical protein QOE64_856 [Frankiales bacterium]|nr:hypothetical protein [Frankiales bacterium]